MKKHTVITPSNIEVEFRLAGAGSRFGAFVIDSLVQLAIVMFFVATTLSVYYSVFSRAGFEQAASGTVLAILIVGIFAINFGYFILLENIMNGQTIGKRFLGLRVIQDNGEPASFFQILVRGFLRTSMDSLYIGLFIILFSKKHKRIGDMAAGTVVISENRARPGEAPAFMLPPCPWPEKFPDSFSMTNEERILVQDFLRRKPALADRGAKIEGLFEECFGTNLDTRGDVK